MTSDSAMNKLRLKAESILATRSPSQSLEAESDSEKRLIHELQTYGLELELQNEELREASVRLESALERYQRLFRAAPVAYLLIDEDSIVIDINHTGTRLLRRDAARIKGRTLITFFNQADRLPLLDHLRDVQLRGEASSGELRLEAEDIPVRLESSKFGGVPDEPQLRLVCCVDCSEQKRLENRLKKALSQTRAADKHKSEFLSNLSHEIRTPLTSIVGYTKLLLNPAEQEERRDWVKRIQKASVRLMEIVNSTLDLSAIESGTIDIKRDTLRLGELFQELEELFQHQAKMKELEFRIESDDQLPEMVEVDRTRLFQCLSNLVSNAIKFTPEKGRVTISAAYRSKNLVISVQDTGPGIPREYQDQVFRPFQRLEGTQEPGTGLGLPITRQLAELMGGALYLDSRPQEGSRFTLQVPIQVTENLERRESISSFQVQLEDHQKVLVVDDDEDIRELMALFLRSLGLSTIFAESGMDAIQLLRTQQDVGLVFLDMRMPKMDGYQTVTEIRKIEAERSLPVVALTGQSLKHELDRALQAGCNHHLSKPVTLEALAEVTAREHYLVSLDSASEEEELDLGEEFKQIREDYLNGLPVRLRELREALLSCQADPIDKRRRSALQDFVHKLKGQGGSFGLQELTNLALIFESALLLEPSLENFNRMKTAFNRITKACLDDKCFEQLKLDLENEPG